MDKVFCLVVGFLLAWRTGACYLGNMKDLVKKEELYSFLNQRTGRFETYHLHTGELLSVDGELLDRNEFAYTVELSDAIAGLVREGRNYKQISEMDGMPSIHTLYVWRNAYPDFAVKLKSARKDRADRYYEKAVEALEDPHITTKDDVPAAKFKFEGYMKLAEKGNPDDYGQQTKVVGDASAPLQIIVQTGILREQLEEPIIVENENEEVQSSVGEQRCSGDGREGVSGVREGSEGTSGGDES